MPIRKFSSSDIAKAINEARANVKWGANDLGSLSRRLRKKRKAHTNRKSGVKNKPNLDL